jgi:nicotinamidase-related amidase
MPDLLSIDPRKSALLLMDFQNFVLDNFVSRDAGDRALGCASALLDSCRAASLLTIHVNVGFRPGYPEIGRRNRLFSTLKGSGLVEPGSEGAKIHKKLAPLQTEPVVLKHRVGAFTGTGLELILRAQEIDTLILAGATTSGVVLSTTRQAFDLDFKVVVAADACVDSDEQLHDVLVKRVLPQHALVASSSELQVLARNEVKASE